MVGVVDRAGGAAVVVDAFDFDVSGGDGGEGEGLEGEAAGFERDGVEGGFEDWGEGAVVVGNEEAEAFQAAVADVSVAGVLEVDAGDLVGFEEVDGEGAGFVVRGEPE